jgi:hypothetical protein
VTAALADHEDVLAAVRLRRQQLDRQAGQAEQLAVQISETEAEIERYRVLAERERLAGALLTTIGELTQETARAKVEQLATHALQVVFGTHHSFHLRPGERGGQATLEMIIRSQYPDGEVVETGVVDARGGGLAAVVGFVLRLVMLLLTPELANILWLDEPFAMVSAFHEPLVAAFVAEVTRRARVQVVLSTHSQVYGDFADETIRLTQGLDGVTVVHRGESE